jgi:hypothetical protein
MYCINPLNAELNPICHLLALLGAHYILHVSRIRVKCLDMFRAILYSSSGGQNCIFTASGIVTLKISAWSYITKITSAVLLKVMR